MMRWQQFPRQNIIRPMSLTVLPSPYYIGLTSVPFFCEGQNINIFIPCYMRMILNNIKKIQMKRLTAVVEGYIELTLNLFQVPQKISNFIIQNIQLEFTNGDEITLSTSPFCLVTRMDHLVTFTFGNQIPMILNNKDVFLAPFDLCTVTTSVVVSCSALSGYGRKINIRFNLMDTHSVFDKFKLDLFQDASEFKVSQKHLFVNFVPSEFDKTMFIQHPLTIKQELDRSKSYHYAMYSIAQYRFPGIAIISLFLPIWLFAFANLTIFFQTPQLHDRISSIATLMIAYTAFIPFLRERLPLTSKITFLDINLYLLILTCFVCLYESIKLRHLENKPYKLDYKRNPAFIFCALIIATSIILVLVLFILHKVVWEPQYNKSKQNQNNTSKNNQKWELETSKWVNRSCDQHFSKYLHNIIPVKNLRI